jgi:hypothetical protein
LTVAAAVIQIYSISDRGRRGGGLFHLRLREARQRSTPSLAEGGAAEVFFNSELVLQIRGGGLKYHRYITMPSGSFYPSNCWLVMSVDLADPHCRSISLGRPDEPDPPGNITSCCDSGLDPPPPSVDIPSKIRYIKRWYPYFKVSWNSHLHTHFELCNAHKFDSLSVIIMT